MKYGDTMKKDTFRRRAFLRAALKSAQSAFQERSLALGLADLADVASALACAGDDGASLVEEEAKFAGLLEAALAYSDEEWAAATQEWVASVDGGNPVAWDRMEGLRVLLAVEFGAADPGRAEGKVETAHDAVNHAQCMVETMPVSARLSRRARCRSELKSRARLLDYGTSPWWERLVDA